MNNDYELLLKQWSALTHDESDMIANMANGSALLHMFLADINWVGFYIYKDKQLILGPFQGKPACIRIPIGKGVCGVSAQDKQILRIDNVHEFPSHIACDNASNSEIVIPLLKKGTLLGVLDIDSPTFSRFDKQDEYYLKKFVDILIDTL